MESEESMCKISSVTNTTCQTIAISFENLRELRGVNLKNGVEFVKQYLSSKEFCTNTEESCYRTNIILEFTLGNAFFILKNVANHDVLMELLNLLKVLVIGVNDTTSASKCIASNKDQILSVLNKAIDYSHKSYVRLEAAEIYLELLHSTTSIFDDLNYMYALGLKSARIFEAENKIFYLSHLISILLQRELVTTGLITFLETTVLDYLVKVYEYSNESLLKDEQIIAKLLTCIKDYYKIRRKYSLEPNNIMGRLSKCVPQLCRFIGYSMLCCLSQQLLCVLIYEIYCVPHLSWTGSFTIDIQNLSGNFEQWPFLNSRIFFVIAYLQLKTSPSRCLWNKAVILEAANSFLSQDVELHPSVLKAILWLYPLVSNKSSVSVFENTKKLLDKLNTYTSFNEILTFEGHQLEWLFKTSNGTLKIRLVSYYLSQHNDKQILNTLNDTSVGYILVEFLVNQPNSALALRVSDLILQLKPQPELQDAIAKALCLFCNHPDIYSRLLQAKPLVFSDQTEILISLRILGTCFHTLTSDASIQAACSYSKSLLKAAKEKTDAMMSFCHFSTTIKSLLKYSVLKEDATAIPVLKFLSELVKIQVHYKVYIIEPIYTGFENILRGKTDRLKAGLELLHLVLTHNTQSVFLNCTKQSYLVTFQLVYELFTKEVATISFKVLKMMIVRAPELCCMLHTPCFLNDFSVSSMDSDALVSFIEYVGVWLKRAVTVVCIDIPVVLIRTFTAQFKFENQKYCKFIINSLEQYEELQKCLSEENDVPFIVQLLNGRN